MIKRRRNAGFSLAELLIVVAILVILMGVVFVAAAQYQRKLKHFEAESAAKEIFIAAQNHLSAAENEGLLKGYRGAPDSNQVGTSCGTGEYCVAYPDAPEIWELLLPFGSIDDTVLTGGSYLIRYNLNTATVLEVFYSDRSNQRFGTTLTAGELSTLHSDYAGAENRNKRRSATAGGKSKRVIGWYGGEGLEAPDDYLAEPVIKVTNGNTLKVEISPLAARTGKTLKSTSSMNLILTGVSSGAMKSIPLVTNGEEKADKNTADGETKGWFVVTLDDVTRSGQNFATLCTGFTPGEDLTVRAVAFDNNTLSNIAGSGVTTVNSLFGSFTRGTEDVAAISSFRHLENLDSTISTLNWNNLTTKGSVTARQTTDLDWNSFLEDGDTDPNYPYQPIQHVDTFHNLVYEGQNDAGESYTIWNLAVNRSGNAGVFDSVASNVTVQNLDLVNFKVQSIGSGSVGALAGSVSGSIVNVRAYNAAPNRFTMSAATQNETAYNESDYEIYSASGAAGGLAGSFSGSASGSAAALYVRSGSSAAGGLFGTMSGGTVTASYAGGHTIEGRYGVRTHISGTDNPKIYEYVPKTTGAGRLNVQGTTAGGFVGSLSGGTITDCYTTCSALGSTAAGGFVGSVSGGSTDSTCYCTGLVARGSGSNLVWGSKTDSENNRGAFAGTKNGASLSGRYLIMANYRATKLDGSKRIATTEEDFLPAVGNADNTPGISALDKTEGTYNSFLQGTGKIEGRAYDPGLNVLAEKSGNVVLFGFRPVTGQTVHLGDWPVFETLAVNN